MPAKRNRTPNTAALKARRQTKLEVERIIQEQRTKKWKRPKEDQISVICTPVSQANSGSTQQIAGSVAVKHPSDYPFLFKRNFISLQYRTNSN
jgi:hypothetical protein